jgi:hypothetical protein
MQKAILKLYNKPHTIQHRTIKQLVWEERRGINLTNNRHSFYIDMISIDNLAGSAMVIPYFSFHTATKTRQGKNESTLKIGTPKIGKPHTSDKFWYIDRRFFDRSGWEELKEKQDNINSNSSTILINNSNRNQLDLNNIQEFIEANMIDIDESTSEPIYKPQENFEEFYDPDYDDLLVDEELE